MKNVLKGEKLSIVKEINSQAFTVAINWDQSDYTDYEIDTSLLMLSERGKVDEEKDFIFYNNLDSTCGTVKINPGKINNYQRNISIDLNKAPAGISKILLLLTIDHGAQLNYRFGNINNITFDILEANTGTVLLQYCIEGLTKETAIIALEIYKYNNEWKLLASGNGFNAGLDAILKQYGSDKILVDENERDISIPVKQDFSKKEEQPEPKPETAPVKSISLSKIVLEKKGQSAGIFLGKDKSGISNIKVKLTWTKGVDLDLHAYYKTRDGRFDRVYFVNKGSLNTFPYIYLDRDSGVGNTAGKNEENLTIARLDDHDYILISVNIFRFFGFLSKGENFARYDGRVILQTDDGNTIEVPLTSEENGKWCVIAKIDNTNTSEPKVININQVLKSAPEINQF